MLIIFLVPLWVHEEQMSKIANQKELQEKLRAVIRKNMIFSSIALVGGSVSLISLATLMWIAIADGTPDTYYLRFWALFGISFDSVIGIIAVHAMTSGWQPTVLSNLFKKGVLTTASNQNAAVADANNVHQASTSSSPKNKPASSDAIAIVSPSDQ
jgi:hypothetical protein